MNFKTTGPVVVGPYDPVKTSILAQQHCRSILDETYGTSHCSKPLLADDYYIRILWHELFYRILSTYDHYVTMEILILEAGSRKEPRCGF